MQAKPIRLNLHHLRKESRGQRLKDNPGLLLPSNHCLLQQGGKELQFRSEHWLLPYRGEEVKEALVSLVHQLFLRGSCFHHWPCLSSVSSPHLGWSAASKTLQSPRSARRFQIRWSLPVCQSC